MYRPLLDYIKKTRAAGMPDGQIRQELLKVNWQKIYIEEAFKSLGGADNKNLNIKAIIFIGLVLLVIGFIAFSFWYKEFDLLDRIFRLITG